MKFTFTRKHSTWLRIFGGILIAYLFGAASDDFFEFDTYNILRPILFWGGIGIYLSGWWSWAKAKGYQGVFGLLALLLLPGILILLLLPKKRYSGEEEIAGFEKKTSSAAWIVLAAMFLFLVLNSPSYKGKFFGWLICRNTVILEIVLPPIAVATGITVGISILVLAAFRVIKLRQPNVFLALIFALLDIAFGAYFCLMLWAIGMLAH